MFDSLTIFPFAFWVVIALLIGGIVWAIRHLRDGTGAPTLAVLGTVAAWYVGDALYNDYAGYHAKMFGPGTLQVAWWEVACFLTVFLLSVPWIHRWGNARHLRRTSGVFQMFKYGVGQPAFQKQLDLLFLGCVLIWLALIVIAAIRVHGEILYFFFPFLGSRAEPWGRGRLGSGFDALLTVGWYFQLLVTGVFGVVAALATSRRTRSLAFVCCLFSWPYFIFERTRNSMLAVAIPAILSWVFLRLRGSLLKKAVVMLAFFLLVNAWMGFVIANRTNGTITSALREKGFSLTSKEKVHHEGLNMYEELCWINTFFDQGTFSPSWGGRYFAEIVNVIPRTLWPGKPMIGIDYSIARGQGGESGNGQAGVWASISTGLIGQGVVNFGRLFGPVAAALLMSFWVAILARLDLQIQELGRLPLYFVGLILTFNTGRDITLITLYPFVFGYITVRWLDRWHRSTMHAVTQGRRPRGLVPGSNRQRSPLRFGKRRSSVPAKTTKFAARKPVFPYASATSRHHL